MEHYGVRARHLITSRHVNFPLSRRDPIAIRRQRYVASPGESSNQLSHVTHRYNEVTSDIHPRTLFILLHYMNWQSIIDTDDFQVVIASVRILCETVNEFLNRVTDTNRDDDQLLIKCDILR